MLDAQIDLILDDLKHGRKTIDDLVAQKALYDGGNAMLTSLVRDATSDQPVAYAFAAIYMSICIVLRMLLAWFPHLFEDDTELDMEEAA